MSTLYDFPIVSRFSGVQHKSPVQAYACCPAHEDSRQSLGIGIGKTGNLGLKCFAGCSTEEILQAVGGTYADLQLDPKTPRSDGRFAPSVGGSSRGSGGLGSKSTKAKKAKAKKSKSKKSGKSGSSSSRRPSIVKAYDYRDESGKLLFQVCRMEPKDFRQRRPDPGARGGWIWSITGVRKVLYRLDQLMEAADEEPDRPVWIVEGEKDADMLNAAGFLATTNPGGAGKWSPEFTNSLVSPVPRNCVVIPDEDPQDPRTGRRPGIDHAYAVARSLKQAGAKSVRVVHLSRVPGPTCCGDLLNLGKVDLGIWIQAGGTPADLWNAASAWPEWDGGEDFSGADNAGNNASNANASSNNASGNATSNASNGNGNSADPAPHAPHGVGVSRNPGIPGVPDLSEILDDGEGGAVGEGGNGNGGDSGNSQNPGNNGTPEDTPPPTPVEDDDDPHRLAHLFLASLSPRIPDQGYSCRYWADQLWIWNGRAFSVLPENEAKARITKSIKAEFNRLNVLEIQANPPAPGERPPAPPQVNTSLVANTLNALKSITAIPWSFSQPSWLPVVEECSGSSGNGENSNSNNPGNGQSPEQENLSLRSPHDFVSMKNGILDLEYLVSPENLPTTEFRDPLLPHSPRFFTPVSLDYSFDGSADCPRWLAFLSRNLENDADRIAMLQEWFGYCLTFDTSFQRFLFLEGEGSNGKSVICAVLSALLGPANVCHVSLESFAKEFALATTLGKLANIVAEIGELDKVAEGVLKSFTAGDRMSFNRKNLPYIEAIPSARLVLSTNNRPRFSDRSGGLWRRMLLLPLNVQIEQSERVHGMDKPEFWSKTGELPGIFNWAIVGLMRLRERRQFTISGVTAAAMEDYRAEANPARAYLLSRYQADVNGSVCVQDVYADYREFCDRSNYRPLATCQFGKEIVRAFPTVKPAFVFGNNGRKGRGYFGISLKPEEGGFGGGPVDENGVGMFSGSSGSSLHGTGGVGGSINAPGPSVGGSVTVQVVAGISGITGITGIGELADGSSGGQDSFSFTG